MNKILRNSMKVAMGGLLLMAGNAMADPTTASLTDAVGDNAAGGGAWLMDVFDESDNLLFDDILTFCVEVSEYIDIGGTRYGIDSVASYATQGGVGGAKPAPDPSGNSYTWDPLDKRTAWLYEKIINGETTYGSVTYGDVKEAYDDAQYAFWVIEQEKTLGEIPGDGSVGTHEYNVAQMIAAAQNAVGSGDYDGTNVVVYNLVTVDTDGSIIEHNQSMLGWKDDTGGQQPIPEPALLLMLGGGLLGMAGLRRRRRMD